MFGAPGKKERREKLKEFFNILTIPLILAGRGDTGSSRWVLPR